MSYNKRKTYGGVFMYNRSFYRTELYPGQICAHEWIPEGDITSVLQICHGMAEYLFRYDSFASFLCDQGVLVCGIDHPGHGKTEGTRGYFAPKNGWETLCRINCDYASRIKQRYPDKAFRMLGHSMGSFVARYIASVYPETACDYIFMGTAGKNGAVGVGRVVAGLIRAFRPDSPCPFLTGLAFGSYQREYTAPRTGYDWLNTDSSEVDKYIADPDCGFDFTASGFCDLFDGIKYIQKDSWAGTLRPEKRYLLISGTEDPVGGKGEGVKDVYLRMTVANLPHVTLKLYPGARHEILNEPCGTDVCSFIHDWIKAKEPKK